MVWMNFGKKLRCCYQPAYMQWFKAHPPLHRTLQDVHSQSAHPQIIAHSLLAGGVELVPIPLVSLPMVASIQARMFQALASFIDSKSVGVVLWISWVPLDLAWCYILREGTHKIHPSVWSAVSSLYTAAATYALGKTMCLYLHHQHLEAYPK